MPPMASTPDAAVILAAGKGTRMRSATAKVLHPLCGRPLAFYPVRRALDAGSRRVVVVVGHQGEAVRAALEAAFPGAPLRFVTQRDQRGTGDAVRCALPEVGRAKRVRILYGDVPLLTRATFQRLVRAGAKAAVALLTTEPADPTGLGRIVRDGHGRVVRIVEHRDCTPAERRLGEINAGIYDVDRKILEAALGNLRADNAQGELYLTDVVAVAVARGLTVKAVPVADPSEVAGVNDRVELARAATLMRRRINEALMVGGVSFEDPANTYVDEGVEIGRDTVIGAGCHLLGETRVGRGVTLLPWSHVEDGVIGDGCRVGPFARVRPGSVLEGEVHLGNFVETKKAHLGRGAKANHLSYLGDAEVGAGTNVGAGTITCNYDGAAKHQTTLGAGCFIGSNTALVAPITVGDGAYVGAGSTLTKDVPAGALAVARGPQKNLEGWVARRAPRKPAGQEAEK